MKTSSYRNIYVEKTYVLHNFYHVSKAAGYDKHSRELFKLVEQTIF